MAWIELHDNLSTHRKTYDLMEELGIKRRDAVGLLCMFWTWALSSAEDGDISVFPARAISDAVDWTHKPQTLLEALVKTGWVDRTGDGKLVIHDWDDYTWRYFDKLEQGRAQTRKRVSEYRERKKAKLGNAKPKQSNKKSVTDVTHEPLPVTKCNAPTVPNLTVPNHRDDKSSLSERGEKTPEQEPETPVSAALSEIGKIYEATTGNLMPATLAREISFRLAEQADHELLKEALRNSIGKRNEGAYFAKVMQSWTAQGIKTHQQLMDKVQTVAPTVKSGGHLADRDVSFNVGEYVDLSMRRLMDEPQGTASPSESHGGEQTA